MNNCLTQDSKVDTILCPEFEFAHGHDIDPRVLRVLIVSNFYPPYVIGGAELTAYNLAVWLAKTGMEVTVVSTCGSNADETDEWIEGVRVLRYFPNNLWWNFERFTPGDVRKSGAKLIWNLRDMWNRDSGRHFGRILEVVKPDIVHTHNIKGFSPIIWRELIDRKISFIHTTHDYHLLCQRGTMLRESGVSCTAPCSTCRSITWLHRKYASQANLICSPSRFVLERHRSSGVVGRGGGVVAPNGVPGVPKKRIRDARNRALRLLFLGQLRREKGAHLLPELLATVSENVHLAIAGDGDLANVLKTLATRDRRLTVHGFISGRQKERLLDQTDILLFPSIWSENAPLVIAEAMMRGIPVIGSDLGAIPEFVRDDVNGLLFPAGNTPALAKCIELISNDEVLFNRLSAGAAQSAENWTIEAMGSRYLQIYRNVLARLAKPLREATC